jgi:transcriptional regulator with XRE-family HTH domain
MAASFSKLRPMAFPDQLTALRKDRGLSQRALAEMVGVHLTQIQRYEGGGGQPTLDVIRRLALALSVSADALVFDSEPRGPKDDDLKLILEAVDRFDAEEKATAKTVLKGLILQHQARLWGQRTTTEPATS